MVNSVGLRPRLVFGDDGSAAADVVWLWINNHRWPHWRISVVTAQPPQWPTPDETGESDLHSWEPPVPRTLFEAARAESVEFLTAAADPRLVFDQCADANLIAIGPRGTGLLKSMHIGSTAEWMVSGHRPLAPTLIVRSARPTREVLVCVDGSEPAHHAVEILAGMPWISDCAVTLLGVSDGWSDPTEGLVRAAPVLAGKAASVDQKEAAAVRGTLALDVKSVVLDLVAELRPDMVALGTRGLGGVKRLVLGSTASTVARYASCSVLVADVEA